MAEPLILIVEGEQSRRLMPSEYVSETEFQTLIAEYPELLAGDQIDRDVPRRFLLVRNEMPISDEEGGPSRWSLDHLFVDQDGMATLVELKRQSDSRLKSDVIGQILGYAANAATWTAERLQHVFEDRCAQMKPIVEPTDTLKAFLGDRNADGFWDLVVGRIHKGEMRLLIVADHVAQDLVRIVEFLNAQMSTTEILAVEVQRYVAGEYATHVPRVFGGSTQARDAKANGREMRHWGDDAFRDDCAAQSLTTEQKAAVLAIYELARMLGLASDFGSGRTPSINLRLKTQASFALLTLKSNGDLAVNPGSFLKPEHLYLATALRQLMAALGLPVEQVEANFTVLKLSTWEHQVDTLSLAIRTLAEVKPPQRAVA